MNVIKKHANRETTSLIFFGFPFKKLILQQNDEKPANLLPTEITVLKKQSGSASLSAQEALSDDDRFLSKCFPNASSILPNQLHFTKFHFTKFHFTKFNFTKFLFT